jgi:hypothetical protein
METRTYTKRREMLDWADIQANLTNSMVVCVPVAIILACRKFIATRGLYRTTYVKSYVSAHEYEIPSVADFDVWREVVSQFLEDTTIMDCADLITELQNIVTAITAQTAVLSAVNVKLSDLSDLGSLPTMQGQSETNLNDVEEQLNEIISQMGGTEVTLT